MAKILVTGSSGFIGSVLVKELRKNKSNKIDVLKKDIRDPNLNLSNFDIIYHLAAISSPSKVKKNESLAWDVNVNGTKNILEKMQSNQKIIFTSSAHVYEKTSNTAKRESDEPLPENFYGMTKLIGESMIKHYSKKIEFNYVILRFFNVYGKGQSSGFLIPDVIKKYSSRKGINIVSSDSAVDMVFIEDVVKVLIESVKKHGTFNVCTGIPTNVLDIYHKIKSNMGIKETEERIFHGKKDYLIGDVTKFKRNFQTNMRALENGLKEIFKN